MTLQDKNEVDEKFWLRIFAEVENPNRIGSQKAKFVLPLSFRHPFAIPFLSVCHPFCFKYCLSSHFFIPFFLFFLHSFSYSFIPSAALRSNSQRFPKGIQNLLALSTKVSLNTKPGSP